MKVFISWSGEVSRRVGELVRDWIPNVLQSAQPWMSVDDIQKGELWFNAISDQLAEGDLGVICITRENMNARWILFESGGLSKGLSSKRVCTLLIDLEPAELLAPLSHFNATRPIKQDLFRLIKTINDQGKPPLTEDRVKAAFEQWWGTFSETFQRIISAAPPSEAPKKRTAEDMLSELLEITRSIDRKLPRPAGLGDRLREMLVRQTPEHPFVITTSGDVVDFERRYKEIAQLDWPELARKLKEIEQVSAIIKNYCESCRQEPEQGAPHS